MTANTGSDRPCEHPGCEKDADVLVTDKETGTLDLFLCLEHAKAWGES